MLYLIKKPEKPLCFPGIDLAYEHKKSIVHAYASCVNYKPQTVFAIPIARFKIGHTPRKLPAIPAATFRFNAYLSAVSTLSAHSTGIILPYISLNCNRNSQKVCEIFCKFLMNGIFVLT